MVDCWNHGLAALAAKLRALLGDSAVLYSNECTPKSTHTGPPDWAAVKVP
eukprot:SAG22_NODE_1014_length_6027_cov_3.998988_7_plen_50_part_00